MTMPKKIIIRITDQQFRFLSECLKLEQNVVGKRTKSSLIRRILNEYFEQNCRNVETGKKSKTYRDNSDLIYSTRNKLRSNNIK